VGSGRGTGAAARVRAAPRMERPPNASPFRLERDQAGGNPTTQMAAIGIHGAPLSPAHFTSTHAACVRSRHAPVNDLCRDHQKPHPAISFFVPQAASAFRGPPVRIAASPHHEPRYGLGFDLPCDRAGAHGGRRRFTGTPDSCADRSKPRPPDRAPCMPPRPHPHPQKNRLASGSDSSLPGISTAEADPSPPTLSLRSRPRLRRLSKPLFPPTWERRYASGMLLLARPSPPEKKDHPPLFFLRVVAPA